MIQEKLLNEFISNQKSVASILLYYAPYKIFNPNKTVSSIKKGEAGLMVDDIKAGEHTLTISIPKAQAIDNNKLNHWLVSSYLVWEE